MTGGVTKQSQRDAVGTTKETPLGVGTKGAKMSLTYTDQETGEITAPFKRKHRERVRLQFDQADQASRTKQDQKDACDINIIIGRWRKQGQDVERTLHALGRTVAMQGQFGDFTRSRDLQSALESVDVAQEMFDDLPAEIRFQFGNNPVTFLHFMEDPENRPKALELGLVKPTAVERATLKLEALEARAALAAKEKAKPSSTPPKPEGNPPTGAE